MALASWSKVVILCTKSISLYRLHMPKMADIKVTIKVSNKIPESPITEIIENSFLGGCTFIIRSVMKMPNKWWHNQITNNNTSNIETLGFRTSPFDWNAIENGINPNVCDTAWIGRKQYANVFFGHDACWATLSTLALSLLFEKFAMFVPRTNEMLLSFQGNVRLN